MANEFTIKRTTTANPDFQLLVKALDHELWVELQEDQATYDQFNLVPNLNTAVIAYWITEPVGIGCFKEVAVDTVEIKRMFVKKEWRGKQLSKQVLASLEEWAREKGNTYAVLETSIHFQTAKNLYAGCGYKFIPNYPPYAGLAESVCMRKKL